MATSPMQELYKCRDGQDFLRYATRHGGRIENGGRHIHIRNERGELLSIPCHGNGQEIGKGLRCKIIKTLIRMGLCGLAVYLLSESGIDWGQVLARVSGLFGGAA